MKRNEKLKTISLMASNIYANSGIGGSTSVGVAIQIFESVEKLIPKEKDKNDTEVQNYLKEFLRSTKTGSLTVAKLKERMPHKSYVVLYNELVKFLNDSDFEYDHSVSGRKHLWIGIELV